MSRPMCFLAVVMMMTVAGPASAGTIRVPSDWPTIQAGIDAASGGDTVLVSEGTYQGVGNRDVDFRGKPIVLLAESGPERTTIDCEQAGRALYFGTGEDTLSVVSGFTITRGRGVNGGGVLCEDTSPMFINMVFDDNSVSIWNGSAMGGAAACFGGSPVFTGCTFRRNSAIAYPNPYAGGGGIGGTGSSLTVRGCLFDDNGACHGSAIHYSWGSAVVVDCTFLNHYGACEFVSSTPTVRRCEFRQNRSAALTIAFSSGLVQDCVFTENGDADSWTGAIGLTETGNTTIERCVFMNNVASSEDGKGGALCCESTQATVSQCDFIGNSAACGGAAYSSGSRVTFSSCTAYGNSATSYGAAMYAMWGSRLVFTNSVLAFNEGDDAIYMVTLWGPSVVTLTCSDVYGNPGGDWVGGIATQLGQSGNICADPLFCSTSPPFDLSIGAGSPCAPGAQPGCGLIGSHGVGCPTAIEARSWGAIKAMFR